MKKLSTIAVAVLLATSSYTAYSSTLNSQHSKESTLSAQRKVVARGTTVLFCGNESIRFNQNGTFVLTVGDYSRMEGTYELKDGGTWVILYVNGRTISCKATVGRDGKIQTVSYNGNVYKKN